MNDLQGQDRHWSRAATRYDELFLDAFHPDVENPLLGVLESVADPASKTAADLGCGPGTLLPRLIDRFGRVIALDFAPAMLAKARRRLGKRAASVTFLERPMHALDDLAGTIDVALAVNSLVMPDVRLIDRTLRAIREALRPGGVFLGIVPSMDAIQYHTMLLMDRALDQGSTREEAERLAAFQAEHAMYEFGFGRFKFEGIEQKFWQPFEIEYRLRKAGFAEVTLDRARYPWDDSMPGGAEFAGYPKSWDWSFTARP